MLFAFESNCSSWYCPLEWTSYVLNQFHVRLYFDICKPIRIVYGINYMYYNFYVKLKYIYKTHNCSSSFYILFSFGEWVWDCICNYKRSLCLKQIKTDNFFYYGIPSSPQKNLTIHVSIPGKYVSQPSSISDLVGWDFLQQRHANVFLFHPKPYNVFLLLWVKHSIRHSLLPCIGFGSSPQDNPGCPGTLWARFSLTI